MADLTVVNYGMGNIGSVVNAFARLGATCDITSDPTNVMQAHALVLPGVGAFHAAMDNIRQLSLESALNEAVIGRRTPFLGICLGLQLIATDSVEGGLTRGLGWIDGRVLPLAPLGALPVPHVGWNEVSFRDRVPLFAHVSAAAHFYFDHSYALQCGEDAATAVCDYGGRCVAAVQKDNIHAVQFHPEKSQRNGLRILRNFLRYIDSISDGGNTALTGGIEVRAVC